MFTLVGAPIVDLVSSLFIEHVFPMCRFLITITDSLRSDWTFPEWLPSWQGYVPGFLAWFLLPISRLHSLVHPYTH